MDTNLESSLQSLMQEGALPGIEQIIPLSTRLSALPLTEAERDVVGDIAIILFKRLEERNYTAMRGGESVVHGLRLADYAVGVLHNLIRDQRRGLFVILGPQALCDSSVEGSSQKIKASCSCESDPVGGTATVNFEPGTAGWWEDRPPRKSRPRATKPKTARRKAA